ncbi:two-component sensor histidine kinase [Sulfuriferula plumbiphila]|uniref:Sensor protein n=1 Tax=Sulfuriferula plumbiphila TaxID=171865 RepID=A0A512L9B3_9PROT|nr:heavy metal sensor histidine kinase [Sulfuriferula plumbiphila]BBP03021.1 two-component sensor histidine kinase [Sulfuriferula plumbiphila]GEP31057.1 two-component sensor histidine kinase [Sulfuriferula plumbiphila]
MTLRRGISLTQRLTLLFAGVTALVFAATGFYLYQALARQLEIRNDVELLGKVQQLRHLLSEVPDVAAIRADPHRFRDVAIGTEGLRLRILDEDGRMVAGVGDVPSLSLSAVTAAGMPTPDAIRDWRMNDGGHGRVLAAWAHLGANAQDSAVLVVLAQESPQRMALLQNYRTRLLIALGGGVAAMALLGFLVVRRGLAPLGRVTAAAGSISPNRMDQRLDIAKAPAEIADLARAFNHMLDRLQEGYERLSQFSADLAHDLRTPISNLMVESQVILARPRSVEEYQALLASNIEEYERLARMAESMLFLARADNAQIALRRENLDMGRELRRIAEYFEGVIDEEGIVLEVSAAGTLNADPVLLNRALSNLIANAIRYTPRGATIRVSARPRPDGGYGIQVANPGAGIAPEHLGRLFDRFYRVDSARADSGAASGLGLSIVKAVMVLHGGAVRVNSGLNGETIFELAFPVEPQGRVLY